MFDILFYIMYRQKCLILYWNLEEWACTFKNVVYRMEVLNTNFSHFADCTQINLVTLVWVIPKAVHLLEDSKEEVGRGRASEC